MRVSSDNKLLRQKRIMNYFIEAANQIIEKEGVGAVTIRKVSDLAGYNSATLYNYFDNLNHLIFLATMGHLEVYNTAIASYVDGCGNSLEEYLAVSECFCKYSFESPEIYELLFFGRQDHKLEEYTQQYYSLFPERSMDETAPASRIIHMNDIYARSSALLASCVEDGYLTQAAADDFNEVALMVYKSILKDVKDGRLDQEAGCEKNQKYYRQLLACYVRPEYRSLLEP